MLMLLLLPRLLPLSPLATLLATKLLQESTALTFGLGGSEREDQQKAEENEVPGGAAGEDHVLV